MASKRHIRRKACQGKRRYADEPTAMNALKSFLRSHHVTGLMTKYHCRFCHGYHIGHAPHWLKRQLSNHPTT